MVHFSALGRSCVWGRPGTRPCSVYLAPPGAACPGPVTLPAQHSLSRKGTVQTQDSALPCRGCTNPSCQQLPLPHREGSTQGGAARHGRSCSSACAAEGHRVQHSVWPSAFGFGFFTCHIEPTNSEFNPIIFFPQLLHISSSFLHSSLFSHGCASVIFYHLHKLGFSECLQNSQEPPNSLAWLFMYIWALQFSPALRVG